MKRLILRLVLACLTSFWVLSLISCQGKEKTPTTSNKYTLIELEDFNGKVNIEKLYNYYYVEFKDNGEFELCYNKKEDNVDVKEFGSYVKTENMYIVNANGMTLNYIILSNTKIEISIIFNKMILELE